MWPRALGGLRTVDRRKLESRDMKNDQTDSPRPERISLPRRLWLVVKPIMRVGLVLLLSYIAAIVIGLIPVNNDFEPTPDGIEVIFISNAVHSDIILPMKTEMMDWREFIPPGCFEQDTTSATHVAIGWGDRGFFIETPQWSDLKVSTAAKALFLPSSSCMHVSACGLDSLPEGARRVRLSAAQYAALVAFVKRSFRTDGAGSVRWIEGESYGSNDAFFEAVGSYHCFNTCNCWSGRAMQAAGIRTGWFTPLPKSMFLYLP